MSSKLAKKVKHVVTEYKLGDFFRNLIAVALGIIITFVGSDLITERKTQKELAGAINLVKEELELNKKKIQDIFNNTFLDQKGAQYLLLYKDSIHKMPVDTLQKYGTLPFQSTNATSSDNALELLKSSALIQQIENKELAFQIIKTYVSIKDAVQLFDEYMKIKIKYQEEFMRAPEIKKYMLTNHNLQDAWTFYLQVTEGYGLVNQITRIIDANEFLHHIKDIDETIAAIEKEYN